MSLLNKLFGRKEIKNPLELVKNEEDRNVLSAVEHGDRIEFLYRPLGPRESFLAIGFFDKIKNGYLIIGEQMKSNAYEIKIIPPVHYELGRISKVKNYSR